MRPCCEGGGWCGEHGGVSGVVTEQLPVAVVVKELVTLGRHCGAGQRDVVLEGCCLRSMHTQPWGLGQAFGKGIRCF